MTEDVYTLNKDKINKYIKLDDVIYTIQKTFKYLSIGSAIKVAKYVLLDYELIYIDMFTKSTKFERYNKKRLSRQDDRLYIDKSVQLQIRNELLEIIKSYDVPLEYTENYDNTLVLNKNTLYEDVRKFIIDEQGKFNFKYDFDSSNLKTGPVQNIDTLQRTNIQIISKSVKFDYPIEYRYYCPQCESEYNKPAYLMASTLTKLKCTGVIISEDTKGNLKSSKCGLTLYPDNEISKTTDCYFYEINHQNSIGEKQTVTAISFKPHQPGFYNCVLYKIKNPNKTEIFHIIDVEDIKTNELDLPKQKEDENYLITLQKTLDKFIEERVNVKIAGLEVLKISLIIQKIITEIGDKLISNIQIVGDRSTGKSMLLKYYSILLYNSLFSSSNGLSISIPSLRGTKYSVTLMGKEQKIVSVGYLGTYKNIHIDEAGENKELVQNLKTFALEDTYSYNKAGSDGTTHVRTAHINLSENIDNLHLQQYTRTIRKKYNDAGYVVPRISNEEDEVTPWNENWDLHLPIYEYDNVRLRCIIQDVRDEYYKNKLFWIDGYDYALHERFPFYFYVVHGQSNNKLIEEAVKHNMRQKDSIKDNLNLIKLLKTESFNHLIKQIKEYRESDADYETFCKVDKILEEYSIDADYRMKTFYYTIVKISRIVNKRYIANEQDYYILRLFLEKTNRRVTVDDISDLSIKGVDKDKQNLDIQSPKQEDGFSFDIPSESDI
jgi:hypothetical protein